MGSCEKRPLAKWCGDRDHLRSGNYELNKINMVYLVYNNTACYISLYFKYVIAKKYLSQMSLLTSYCKTSVWIFWHASMDNVCILLYIWIFRFHWLLKQVITRKRTGWNLPYDIQSFCKLFCTKTNLLIKTLHLIYLRDKIHNHL